MNADLRIHNALTPFRKKAIDLAGFEIHMGLGAYRELVRDMVIDEKVAAYRGLPVKVNLNLADGEIILRYEVKA